MVYTHCSHSNTYPFFTIFCFFLAALSMLYGSRIASLFALFLCTVTAFVCHLLSFCLSHQCSFLQTDCSVSVSIKLNMVKTKLGLSHAFCLHHHHHLFRFFLPFRSVPLRLLLLSVSSGFYVFLLPLLTSNFI